MKEDIHVFSGMRRDSHPIRQDSKYLWDAHNIRLTNRDNDTLFSITNERGTLNTGITFKGYYVGHCILGKYLIVFTASDDSSGSYIYRVEKTDTGYKTIILFNDEDVWDKSWNPSHPIEAVGIYENEFIQKIYWVDGLNQPRVINIAKPELEIPRQYLVNGVNLSGPIYCKTDHDIDQYLEDKFPDGFYSKDSFNFARTLKLQETFNIYKIYGQGVFSPGTIQYAFSYYSKYGQESSIFYTTPIYYISPRDRGGKADEKVANSFKIEISSLDTAFDYIRIYSIHRTSINSTPEVKIVEDIQITSDTLSYIDSGNIGSTIDPTQLLYIGGEQIIAGCIAHKDNTLFLGNITQVASSNFNAIKNAIKADYEIEYYPIKYDGLEDISLDSSFYNYTPKLSRAYSGAFKCGETYRLGIQFQYSTGKWSEPIYISDEIVNSNFVWQSDSFKESLAIRLIGSKDNPIHSIFKEYGIRKLRTCVVYPQVSERERICQGILCPTVYNVLGRKTDSPYAMSSWFFRPATKLSHKNEEDIYSGAAIQFQHNYSLYTGNNRGAEIQNMSSDIGKIEDVKSDTVDDYLGQFFVDENIVTFHSPDLEFDTDLANFNFDGVKLYIIGVAKLGAISGDINIETSSPVAYPQSMGFNYVPLGYQTYSLKTASGGLVSGLFYKDRKIKKLDYSISDADAYWMVYPWHRSGSLNNDARRSDDNENKSVRSAVLSKKKISNLKFFDKNSSIMKNSNGEYKPTIFRYEISTPQLFSSNEVSMLKIKPSYLNKEVPYLGNVDTLSAGGKEYPIYCGSTFESLPTATEDTYVNQSNDPVRIKYKSSPHLVFSLGNSNGIELLPRDISTGDSIGGDYTIPDWQNPGTGEDRDMNYTNILSLYLSNYPISMYFHGDIPESYKDTVCIGKTISQPLTPGKYYLVRIERGQNGLLQAVELSKEAGEELVLKIAANRTISRTEPNSAYALPGTTLSDYDRDGVYKGVDRYYKVIYKDSKYIDHIEERESPTEESSISTVSTTQKKFKLKQPTFGDADSEFQPYMLIGELVRDNIINKFGGTSEEAIKQNLWLPASEPVTIDYDDESDIVIPYEYGDTWYSRYDCLKTYPFTQEDENSVIEIGSFMCETRVNIDGRCDRNRGQISNINMSPQVFNLFNEVYSQKDNFFNYRVLDDSYYRQNTFESQVIWSKEKQLGEDIDTWTTINLSSSIDLNGDKGKVTSIKEWNELLLCFQEKAINRLMFNNRVQIPASDGVPVEISNSYKMDGSRVINSTIGCYNKWSILPTMQGIYFLDSNTDSIYIYNGQLANLSETKGMNSWVRQIHSNEEWSPIPVKKSNTIRTFYDNKYKDVYFTPGPLLKDQQEALCFSEQLGEFTSFMSYGGATAMFNYEDGFYSLYYDDKSGYVTLYKNFKGAYNNIFDKYVNWELSFISNDNPTLAKIFDTVDIRADIFNSNNQLLNSCPINYLAIENEYQKGETINSSLNMKKKFRVWRGQLPRNNFTRQRICNLWLKITMGFNNENQEDKGCNVLLHDISVNYTPPLKYMTTNQNN